MAKTPYRQRFGEGIVFIAIGVFILLVLPHQIRVTPAFQTQTSPRFIPGVVSVLLIITGIAMVAASFFGRIKDKPVDITKTGAIRAVGAMLLLLAYSLLFPVVGFVVTSVIFFVIFAFLFGARSVLRIGLSSIGVSVVVWLVFEHVFRVPLPHGFLF